MTNSATGGTGIAEFFNVTNSATGGTGIAEFVQ